VVTEALQLTPRTVAWARRRSRHRVPGMDEVLSAYFAAWNEPDIEVRRQLLSQCVESNTELVDPTGRWQGVEGLAERIERYRAAAPGTTVVPASDVDAHNDVVRYAWAIIDPEGRNILDGMDVAERTPEGRLRRILMFHGPLSVAE
jgi:hypothetical protein